MQNLDVNKTVNAWSSLADSVFVPHTEEEYQRLVKILDGLIDEVGEDESHPLASLMEIVGVLVQKFEDDHVAELSVEWLLHLQPRGRRVYVKQQIARSYSCSEARCTGDWSAGRRRIGIGRIGYRCFGDWPARDWSHTNPAT